MIRYGFEEGSYPHNTTVTGFSTTINSLPANQPIWVSIAATDLCATGDFSPGKLVGSPHLPNAGIGQSQSENLFKVLANSLIDRFSTFMRL